MAENTKHIGIITIHNSPSYGASLQSYALYKYIENCGHHVEMIDLHRPYQNDYKKSAKYRLYNEKDRPLSLIIKLFVSSLINRCLGKNDSTVSLYSNGAVNKFEAFNSLVKFSKPYYGCDELYAAPPIYDIYITGSDQVWNPYQPYCIEPYFLTFAPKGKKRMSYAASLGIDSFPNDILSNVKEWLAQYDAISVREEQTRRYLEDCTGLKITKVADPTFLLTRKEWKEIAESPSVPVDSYILLFSLNHKPELLDYCKKLSADSGLPILSLRMHQPEYKEKDDYIAVTDAGPREFLGYIQNASLVITDSFHGTVFSFLMEAGNVFTYISKGNKRGVRIENLYNELGCDGHIFYGELNRDFQDLQQNSIDRQSVNSRIDEMHQDSILFLNKELYEQ